MFNIEANPTYGRPDSRCILQIRAGAILRGLPVAVEHPIDLLAAAHGI
jgi:hypothetical protein